MTAVSVSTIERAPQPKAGKVWSASLLPQQECEIVASSPQTPLGSGGTGARSDYDLSTTMELTHEGRQVSDGLRAACLGHPLNAVVWLANTLLATGSSLEAGHIVLSGALDPMVPVAPSVFEAAIDGLGTVCARFEDEEG